MIGRRSGVNGRQGLTRFCAESASNHNQPEIEVFRVRSSNCALGSWSGLDAAPWSTFNAGSEYGRPPELPRPPEGTLTRGLLSRGRYWSEALINELIVYSIVDGNGSEDAAVGRSCPIGNRSKWRIWYRYSVGGELAIVETVWRRSRKTSVG